MIRLSQPGRLAGRHLLVLAVLAAIVFSVYSVYDYLSRNNFQKLLAGEKPLNFLVLAGPADAEGEMAFIAQLHPVTSQGGLTFIHPDLRWKEDSPTLGELMSSGDGDDFTDPLAALLGIELHYTLRLTPESGQRVLDLLEGIHYFVHPDSLGMARGPGKLSPGLQFLSGDLILEYARALRTDKEDNRLRKKLRRMKKQQGLVLQTLLGKKNWSRIFESPDMLAALLRTVDISPRLGVKDLAALRDLAGRKSFIYRFFYLSAQTVPEEDPQKLVFLPEPTQVRYERFRGRLGRKQGLARPESRIQVMNGARTNADGLGRRVSYRLKTKGYKPFRAINFTPDFFEEDRFQPTTVVLDQTGYSEQAFHIARDLKLPRKSVSVYLESDKSFIDTVVILGEDFPRPRKKKNK